MHARCKGGNGVQKEVCGMLEVTCGQEEERLIHLEAVLALPVPSLCAQLLGLLQPVLYRPPVPCCYVQPAGMHAA